MAFGRLICLTDLVMLSATVKIGDQNYYRQFTELSWKN